MIQIITAYTNGTNSFPQIFSSFDFIQLFLNGSVRIKTVLLQLFCAIYQYAEPIFFSPEFGESLFDMLGSLDHINKKILYQLISILLYRIDEEEQANFILEKAMEVEFMETLNNDCLSENDDLAECANELLKLITTDSDNE